MPEQDANDAASADASASPSVRALRLDRVYDLLVGEDGANQAERACEAIPDSACTDVPRNYVLNVANGAATKLAEQLAGPGLVLPWLLAGIGAPAALAGLLMPAKQAGALLPQLAVAGWIRSVARRKWVWVAAGLIQAALLGGIVLAALALPPVAAGGAIVVAFLLFSMASGMGSVAFQDVVGKTVPKGRRGRLLANRAFIGGALTLVAALGIRQFGGGQAPVSLVLLLVLVAAVLWALGALALASIGEAPGATEGGRSMLREVRAGFTLLREVPGFRRFVWVRGLLLAVELAAPFYALHAATVYGHGAPLLGLYVLATGVANLVASPFWGRWSDTSSRTTMAVAGGIGVAAGGLALGAGPLVGGVAPAWVYAGVFVLAGIAEAGLRLGRKTYLVDGAPSDERPLYTAFSNTLAGLLAVLGGAVGLLADRYGPGAAIGLLTALTVLGVLACARLPEAERMTAQD